MPKKMGKVSSYLYNMSWDQALLIGCGLAAATVFVLSKVDPVISDSANIISGRDYTTAVDAVMARGYEQGSFDADGNFRPQQPATRTNRTDALVQNEPQ